MPHYNSHERLSKIDVLYLKFDRITFDIRTLLSETRLSALTTATVFFLFFPFSRTVSPLNNPNSSILAEFNMTVEWSSITESSTKRVFAVSFLVKMAVAKDSCISSTAYKQSECH